MTNPYVELDASHFWAQAVAGVAPHLIDPVVETSFRIRPTDRVATMGSCFAQHISRGLTRYGMQAFVTEPGPADLTHAERVARGFGVFTARSGNIYTARQAVQLFDHAFGRRTTGELAWRRSDDRWVDPLRPRAIPEGFATPDAMLADRQHHLTAVRRMFEESDVLIFTLGLTEAWLTIDDGTVLPVVPGPAGGEFDPERYQFMNFSVMDVMQDLQMLADRIAVVNPSVQVVLTVSPVPLIATFTDTHVLVATTHSKAILRAAAGEVVARHERWHYFPSYEIITGPAAAGRYFDTDLRSVTPAGVDHVMRTFARHHLDAASGTFAHHVPGTFAKPAQNEKVAQGEDDQIICDEEVLILVPDKAASQESRPTLQPTLCVEQAHPDPPIR